MKVLRLIISLYLFTLAMSGKAWYAIVEHVGAKQGMPQARVTDVLHDKNGYIWLSTWGGLVRYDGYSAKIFRGVPGKEYGLPSNRIYKIFQSNGGKILCKTEKEYFVFDPATGDFHEEGNPGDIPEHYHAPDSVTEKVGRLPEFAGKEFTIIYQDRQDGYWVSSNRGIDRVHFRPAPLSPVMFSDEMEENVRCIGNSPWGIFFADKNGFVRLQVDDGENHPLWLTKRGISMRREGFGSYIYSSIYFRGKNKAAKNEKDTLLLGTKPDGLFIVTEGKTDPNTELFLPSRGLCIYDIHRDSLGRVWLATLTGLYCIDDFSRNVIRKIKGFDRVRVLEEHNGTLLVGGDKGLKSLRLYSGDNSHHTILKGVVVMDISVHIPSRYVYLATYGSGLLRIDESQIAADMVQPVRYTTSQGLASDNLFSITQWNGSNLYLVSEDALTVFNPGDNSTIASRGAFTDKFAFTECKPFKINSSDEAMLFGTTQGVLRINTGDLPSGDFVPRIVFSCPDSVFLSSDKRSFTITFAALDYNKSEDISYAYRLEGLDDDWTITHERTVVYANLPPGKYKFHVRSTNGTGQWVANEHTVSIYSEARLTETRAFWIGVGVVLLLVVILVYTVIKYILSLRRELREMAAAKDERLEYLSARLHDMLSGTEVTKPEQPQEENRFKKNVCDFLEAHYSNDDISIDDMGKELGMGRTKLFSEIKQAFGVSPNNLLQEYRIRKAADMLASGGMNVSEVAYAVGFGDPKYFSRVFKKYKGVSPSDFIAK